MSEQQTEWFRLRRIDNGDIEETCKELLGGKPLSDFPRFIDSYREALLEGQWDNNEYKYEVTPQGVYEILEYKDYGCDPDIFQAFPNNDGTVNVLVSYYNGGCSSGEAIEIALEKINE